jgi:nucleoside-diphosphate kinase
MEKNLAGEVIARLEKAGLRITAAKLIPLTDAVLTDHYAHIKDRPFFPEILEFMKSRPVLGLVFAGSNAVAKVRELLGPTDSRKAPKGTIRGDLGTDSMRNIAHASDSTDAAEAEVKRFFQRSEVFN